MKPLLGLLLTLSVAWLCECVPAGADEPLKPGQSFKDCATDCPEMVVIPAGSFTMGSPQYEPGHKKDEAPQHNVTIAKPFAVSKFEVTFAEWDACAAKGDCMPHVDDDGWGRDRQPVINVSWNDAQRYVAWLAKITGKTYRLLSEAEYEYAARAGTQTAYPWGDKTGTNNANCSGCGSKWDATQTAPVGSFRRQTSSVSMTWLAMSGSGSRIARTRTTISHRSTAQRGSPGIAANIAFAAVPGRASSMKSAPPIAAEAQPPTGSTSSASALVARLISRALEVSSWHIAATCSASTRSAFNDEAEIRLAVLARTKRA